MMTEPRPTTAGPSVPWVKAERLLAAGNRLADELDLREEHPDGKAMAEVLADWDRARQALAPEQEAVRRRG